MTSETQPPFPAAPVAPATVGFRLDSESRKTLGERAARLGVSPHELAKEYVMQGLHAKDERTAMWAALKDVLVLLQRLRGDIATTAEALMIRAGEVDEKEARAWLKRNFN
jgi:hypothetical protein